MRPASRRGLLLWAWAVGASVLHADLRIVVPPGPPLEWFSELPVHALDDASAAPKGALAPRYTAAGRRQGADKETPSKTPPRRTAVARKKQLAPERPVLRQAPPVGAFDPLTRARVATVDIVGHEQWTQFKARSKPEEYPPAPDEGLHWFSISTFLVPAYYPARSSTAETLQLLVTMGAPVLSVLPPGRWGRERSNEMISYLRDEIPRVPSAEPDVEPLLDGVGEDPEMRMLTRWAAQTLVADHFFTLDPSYCRYLRLLGSDALPAVLACSRSKHSLLRENAVGLLARYSSTGGSIEHGKVVRKRLLEVTGEADAVARNRALEGLVRQRAWETEKTLVAFLEEDDSHLRPHALRLLSRLGALDARASILDAVRGATSDDRGELWLAATHALAVLPDPDKKSRRVVSRLGKLIVRKPRAFDVAPEHMVDDPDHPGDRARMLEQAVRLTLAILGEKKQRRFLTGVLAAEPGADPPSLFTPPYSERFLPLGGVSPLNRPLAIRLLAILAAEESKMEQRLKEIVKSQADLILRRFALGEYAEARLDDGFVADVAGDDDNPSALRIDALYRLVTLPGQRSAALGVANAMIKKYHQATKDVEDKPSISRRDECLAALRLLGDQGALKVKVVRGVFREALERKDWAHVERSAGKLRIVPPLVETAVVELAKLHKDADDADRLVEPLLGLLKTPDQANENRPVRVDAALALSVFPRHDVAAALVDALGDKAPWVRYAAFRALRGFSGKTYFADWLFGKESARNKAHEAWAEWLDGAKFPRRQGE